MDQDILPTEADFNRDGFIDICPEDIPEKQIDKCSVCLTTYGQRADDGQLEQLVRLQKCGHIVGRECLTDWLVSIPPGHKKGCPVCRAELYVPVHQQRPLNGLGEAARQLHTELDRILSQDPLGYVVLNEENSLAIRQSTDIIFDDSVLALLDFHQLRAIIRSRVTWPAELGVTEGDTRGLLNALTSIKVWMALNHYRQHSFNAAEHEMMLEAAGGVHGPALNEPGNVDDVWARIPDGRIGRLTKRLTLIFVHTYLACALGRLPSQLELLSIA